MKEILSTTVTANVAIVAAIDWNQKTFSIMKLVKGLDFIDSQHLMLRKFLTKWLNCKGASQKLDHISNTSMSRIEAD